MTYPRICAYTYKADIYCPDCILDPVFNGTSIMAFNKDVELSLTMTAEELGIDRFSESTFDSDDFPKVVFGLDLDISEGMTCGTCGKELG